MVFDNRAASFRPERLFIDEDALIVEYSVQTYNEVGEKVRSFSSSTHHLLFCFVLSVLYKNDEDKSTRAIYLIRSTNDNSLKFLIEIKQYRVYTQDIDDNVDVSKLARKIIKKCKYIPPQWLSQVEDLLIEMRERRRDRDAKRTSIDNTNDVERKIKWIIDLCYGDTNEQVQASHAVLSLCQDFSQLEVIANHHHQLISAFTRILTDKTQFSLRLVFNILNFFLLLADYSEFHPILIDCKVGSIVMALGCRNISGLGDTDIASSNHDEYRCRVAIFNISISILIRLSDDIDILRKMTKNGIASLFDFVFMANFLPEWPLGHGLYLFQRASIFEEVIKFCRDDQSKIIEGLVSLLSSKSKDIISERSLKILYNLSFDKDCCKQMLFYGLPRRLCKLSRNVMTWKLVYQISTHGEYRKRLLVPEWEALIKNVAIEPSKYATSTNEVEVVHATLINLTNDPLWAEMMIPLTSSVVKSIQKSKCVMQVKVLRNLSKWTHDLQQQIGVVGTANDETNLKSITRYPDKYVTSSQGENETSRNVDIYGKYKALGIWEESIPHFVKLLSTVEDEHLILELLATFNRLTMHDLPSKSWHTSISHASLLRFIQRALTDEKQNIDIILEIIILCTELCNDHACLEVMLEANIISQLLAVWDDCGDDEEIQLHLLTMCERVLFDEEGMSILLLSTDTFQYISDSANHGNSFIKAQAIRCLDAIVGFHTLDKDDDIEGRFSALAKEKRFSVYNAAWVENTIAVEL